MGSIHVFPFKLVTTHKSTPLVAYPRHTVFSNVSFRRRKWLKGNVQMLEGLLPVCFPHKNWQREAGMLKHISVWTYDIEDGVITELRIG